MVFPLIAAGVAAGSGLGLWSFGSSFGKTAGKGLNNVLIIAGVAAAGYYLLKFKK
ncbi:MAG: hypothetical protein KC589_08840 [Nanoarchaeota archaeon]|nr:hypothetical protein [Nanoarchaeota archaeon]MCA9497026.1 hypothetical protein [Nanoarchaeota archaeon]